MDRRHFLKSAAAGGAMLVTGRTTSAAQQSAEAKARKPLKLKYSVRSHWFSDLPMDARFERIHAEGFRAIENNGFKRMPKAEKAKYGKKLQELGMEHGVFVANQGLGGGAGLTLRKMWPKCFKQIKDTVQAAPYINAKYVTLLTGMEDHRVIRGLQKATLIQGLRRVGDMLGKAGITGVVEPLNAKCDHAGYFLSRSDEAYAIMKAVDHPHIKILFDIYHQQITEGNLILNIRQFWDEIGYFQFADVPGRHEPGTGEINYRNVFKAIYEMQSKTSRELFVGAELGPSKGVDTAGTLACFEAIRQADDFET